ncbi:MAG: DUF819 family protein, partial [Romboutsia timonensis]|nr:DUF819 family protein [Romboutsia timonensis]
MATAVVGPPIQAFDASNNSSNLNLNILPTTKVTTRCINTASIQNTNINAPFLIYLFFVVLGVPASISEIIKNGAFILIFCILAVFIHLVVTLAVGKMFKFKLDELLLASNACIGGPTTAVAMAIAKGWNSLIVPTMIAGV